MNVHLTAESESNELGLEMMDAVLKWNDSGKLVLFGIHRLHRSRRYPLELGSEMNS